MPANIPKLDKPSRVPGDGPRIGAILVVAMCCALEGGMLILLYGTYSETMGMMSDVYLCDLPGIGRAFCAIDDEMTVSHLLALLLAIFSIAVQLAIWSEFLRQRIYEDPQGWFAVPTNKVYAAIALGLFGIIFALETVNLYTLIARETIGGPFMSTDMNPLMEFLAANQGLGIFVAILVALVNAVLALLTVRTVHALTARD